MKGLEEIYKMNGQDVSFANQDGIFEQRSYGQVYIPPCYCDNILTDKEVKKKLNDNPK